MQAARRIGITASHFVPSSSPTGGDSAWSHVEQVRCWRQHDNLSTRHKCRRAVGLARRFRHSDS
jgi:hypothetical protein